jgi:hypothetical protein
MGLVFTFEATFTYEACSLSLFSFARFIAPILSIHAHWEYSCPRLFGECYSDGYQSWTTEVGLPLSIYAVALVFTYITLLGAHGITRIWTYFNQARQ